jgi:hypothetical protein
MQTRYGNCARLSVPAIFSHLPGLIAGLLIGAAVFAGEPDPWAPGDLLAPDALAHELAEASSPPPTIVFVGFPMLYRGRHIARAILAGPASKPEGLAELKEALKSLPKDSAIVIYCGCCPFIKCPNIRPAFRALRELGYTRIRVLSLPENLRTDWTDKGYPTETGSP